MRRNRACFHRLVGFAPANFLFVILSEILDMGVVQGRGWSKNAESRRVVMHRRFWLTLHLSTHVSLSSTVCLIQYTKAKDTD